MANGNGNGDRLTWRTVTVIIAIGSPIAGLSVAGYVIREQVRINAAQEAKIDQMEKENMSLQYDVKRLREDMDEMMNKPRRKVGSW